mmetsp:Transcript_6724/g.9409  ORF Transcript_6724/g.9409 Transcript_6724/m.9409 type:complete len:180 (-) Transcript_6724:133-672(-)
MRHDTENNILPIFCILVDIVEDVAECTFSFLSTCILIDLPAVRVKVPASTVPEFTKEYAKLFDKQGDRPDKGDRGLEYRSVIGLPGGQSSPFYNQVKEILQDAKGLNLMTGKGNDPDTLGKKNVWLYDTNSFPLYQAEVYHQMHDGFFPGENYPSEYNALNKKLFEAGRFVDTGCPDII